MRMSTLKTIPRGCSLRTTGQSPGSNTQQPSISTAVVTTHDLIIAELRLDLRLLPPLGTVDPSTLMLPNRRAQPEHPIVLTHGWAPACRLKTSQPVMGAGTPRHPSSRSPIGAGPNGRISRATKWVWPWDRARPLLRGRSLSSCSHKKGRG